MILDGEETEFLFFPPTFCCAIHKKLGFDRCEATVCVGVAARAAGMAFYTTGSLSLNTFRVHPLDPDDEEDVAAHRRVREAHRDPRLRQPLRRVLRTVKLRRAQHRLHVGRAPLAELVQLRHLGDARFDRHYMS